MKKSAKFDYTMIASVIVAASIVFIATLFTYTPEPQMPVSIERMRELILRAAGGFAILAAFAVFVTLVVWREIREPSDARD